MSSSSRSAAASVRDFFFAEETPYGLAAIRILLPLILLCVVLPRWSHTRELFSTDGAPSPLAVNYGVMNFPPEPSGTLAVAMMTALAFCLVTASVGWHTRLSLAVSWALYTYLNMLDSLSTFTKYSVISSHVLLLLTLSDCGAVWSIDAWRRRGQAARRSPVWPRRLVQLLVGLIYFGASFTKLHTDGFISGDQIRYWLLTNLNNANPLGEYLALYPEMIVIMSHIAVVWQVVFLFISWRGYGRLCALGMGTLFHLSTVWILGLFIFPPIMITTYLAWLSEEDVRKIRRRVTEFADRVGIGFPTGRLFRLPAWLLRFGRAVPVPSLVLMTAALSTTVVLGLEVEQRLDPYQERGPDGPLVLTPMSDDEVQLMLGETETIREADKFFSMEVGRETMGGVLVGRTNVCRAGERVLVQCTLIPPHQDMWVACSLMDETGNEILRAGQPVTREARRVDFSFIIPTCIPPGTYRFTAFSGTAEVLSRTVTITASEGVCDTPQARRSETAALP